MANSVGPTYNPGLVFTDYAHEKYCNLTEQWPQAKSCVSKPVKETCDMYPIDGYGDHQQRFMALTNCNIPDEGTKHDNCTLPTKTENEYCFCKLMSTWDRTDDGPSHECVCYVVDPNITDSSGFSRLLRKQCPLWYHNQQIRVSQRPCTIYPNNTAFDFEREFNCSHGATAAGTTTQINSQSLNRAKRHISDGLGVQSTAQNTQQADTSEPETNSPSSSQTDADVSAASTNPEGSTQETNPTDVTNAPVAAEDITKNATKQGTATSKTNNPTDTLTERAMYANESPMEDASAAQVHSMGKTKNPASTSNSNSGPTTNLDVLSSMGIITDADDASSGELTVSLNPEEDSVKFNSSHVLRFVPRAGYLSDIKEAQQDFMVLPPNTEKNYHVAVPMLLSVGGILLGILGVLTFQTAKKKLGRWKKRSMVQEDCEENETGTNEEQKLIQNT